MANLKVVQGGKDDNVQHHYFRSEQEDLEAAKELLDNLFEIYHIKETDLLRYRLADHLLHDCGFMVQRVELDVDYYMNGPYPAQTTLLFDKQGKAI